MIVYVMYKTYSTSFKSYKIWYRHTFVVVVQTIYVAGPEHQFERQKGPVKLNSPCIPKHNTMVRKCHLLLYVHGPINVYATNLLSLEHILEYF